MSDKQRLFYPDAMRGLAMYSIVLGHLSMFCFGLYSQALILQYIVFVLPGLSMFMVISGYFSNPEKINMLKRLKLLIPFFIFGLLYSYLCTNFTALSFIEDRCKNGYWFLFELVIFNAIVWIISKSKINMFVGYGIIQLVSIITYFGFLRHTPIADVIGLYYWCTYLPFFFIGICIRCISIDRMYVKRNVVFAGSFCMIVALLIIRYLSHGSYWPTHIAELLISLPVSICLLLLLYIAETRCKGKLFYGKKMLKKVGSHIGKYTLEIYVLHYFVMYSLSGLHSVGLYMKNNDCLWLEIIISPFIALFVCYSCIGIAKIFEKAKLGFLFGK